MTPPLPDDAQGGAVTFYVVRAGVLPGWRAASRAEATHARIELRGLDGETTEREVDMVEAEAFLAEVERMHAAEEAWSASAAEREEERAEERAGTAAEVDVACPHCGVPRRYEGRRDVMSAGAPDQVAREESFQLARPETRAYEEYACPRCGSVELFRAGRLEHPLPGAESEPDV